MALALTLHLRVLAMNDQLQDISLTELEHVTGGRRSGGGWSSWNPFGWLDNLYKSVVNHFGAQIGGNKLAEKMYGRRTNDGDRHRAQVAMRKFLDDGHKLPKGVPNLFG
ncbi:MAG TPA: hypothetical protein VL326_07315 [Kofleriaceae bacterium]|nr:hypothetical protein [Kofleriaceae bacterium]